MIASELCLGTWDLGGLRSQLIPAEEAVEVLIYAFAQGVTLVDCSNVYGNGRSEVLVGIAADRYGGAVQIVTKVGYLTGIDGTQSVLSQYPQAFDRRSLLHSVDDSRRRLNRDVIDVLLLHDPSEDVCSDPAVWDMLYGLVAAGTVRAVGASTGYSKALHVMEHGAKVIEIPLNQWKHDGVQEVLSVARERSVGVLARSPFGNGRLFTSDNTGSVQSALRFVLAHEGVSSVVAGFKSLQELRLALDTGGPVPNRRVDP
jgi:aryl-alcohol dehydrogenase-like predicted oxidoreductase